MAGMLFLYARVDSILILSSVLIRIESSMLTLVIFRYSVFKRNTVGILGQVQPMQQTQLIRIFGDYCVVTRSKYRESKYTRIHCCKGISKHVLISFRTAFSKRDEEFIVQMAQSPRWRHGDYMMDSHRLAIWEVWSPSPGYYCTMMKNQAQVPRWSKGISYYCESQEIGSPAADLSRAYRCVQERIIVLEKLQVAIIKSKLYNNKRMQYQTVDLNTLEVKKTRFSACDGILLFSPSNTL
jgi:hypothetical protein